MIENSNAHYCALFQARRSELSDIMKWPRIGKSHRTCISMLDSSTASLLGSVREKIMSVYSASDDVKTKSMWIPAQNVIPVTDLHVTVATPWWWHTLTESHGEITSQMSSRLRQTLLLGMHHPFSIEVDTVTFAGTNLVVLWRTVGPRGDVTDRHSTERDPFVHLRREIARCFTTASSCGRREPLTHTSLAGKGPPTLKRHNTIEEKTPGMGEGDGFIHTTLARLPKSMSRYNVYNRDVVKGLCDEATKMLSGRRILINHIRFLHTTGLGGGSNPCVQPLFDETIPLPEKKAGRTVGPVRDVERIGVKGILFDEEDGE